MDFAINFFSTIWQWITGLAGWAASLGTIGIIIAFIVAVLVGARVIRIIIMAFLVLWMLIYWQTILDFVLGLIN